MIICAEEKFHPVATDWMEFPTFTYQDWFRWFKGS